MSKKTRKIAISSAIIAIIASLIFGSVQTVLAYKGDTESSLKSALQYGMLYQCAKDYGNNLFLEAAKGDKFPQIFADYDSYHEYIGTAYGLGDSNGYVTCRKLAQSVLGSSTISDRMVTDGILKGVYEYSGSSEKKISCSYGIINSEKTGLFNNGQEYYWPAGYFSGAGGNYVNKTSHGAIWVVYDENGPSKLEGATSDIDVEHTLSSMKSYSINWKDDSKICSNLIKYTDVYSYEDQDINGQTRTFYAPVRATTCGEMESIGCWITSGNQTNNAAWLNTNSPAGFWYHTEDVADATKLVPTSNAAANFMSNIQSSYLDGSAGLTAFLNSHADAKYLLYGRYLFNGDGGNSGGCKITAVPKSDITSQKIDTTYWDTSLSYIKEFSPWDDSGSKVDYVGKIGGNGVAEAGDASIGVFLPSGNTGGQEYKTCSALMDDFKSVIGSVSGNTAKKTVYAYIGAVPAEDLPPENDDPNPDNPDPNDPGTTDDTTPKCYQAAESLGWILCPVIEAAGNATDKIYSFIESNFLQLKAELFASGNTTYTGWTNFRNFANILFAIAFVVVILSQVTGIGINNYGVKKILPRLIMVVVLVNLSYILCQIAVDLSNIVGSGLYDLFEDLAGTVTPQTGSFLEALGNSVNVRAIVVTLLATLGLASGTMLLINNIEIWLLPILLAVLGAIISVLTLFITLGIRQAGIIILVVLSPLAIICYALPNTKKIFDKWLHMLSSLLMVYPIASALMGGGQYASKLLVNIPQEDSGFFYMLVAMLLGIVPVFFIPSIVRKSLDAIGGLGSKIQNLSSRASRGLQRGIRDSEWARDFQRDQMLKNDERIAHKLQRRRDRQGGTLSDRDARRLNRRVSRANRARLENEEAAAADGKLFSDDPNKLERLKGKFSSDQRDRDVQEWENSYANGAVSEFDDTTGTAKVDSTDLKGSLKKEHAALLTALRTGKKADGTVLTDSERETTENRLRAVQNLMADQAAGQNSILENFRSAMKESHTNGESSELSFAASHLIASGAAGKFKKDNRELFSLTNDLNNRQYHDGAAGSAGFRDDANFLQQYGLSGANDYTEETIGGVDPEVLGHAYEAMSKGYGTASQRANFAALANGALNNPNVKLQPKVRDVLNKIASAGAGAGAAGILPSNARYNDYSQHTEGSRVLAKSGGETFDAIDKHLQEMASGGPLTSEQEAEVRNLGENLRRAAHGPDSLSAATSEGIQKVMNTIHSMGVTDQTGAVFQPLDPTSLKISGRAPVSAAARAQSYESQYRNAQIPSLSGGAPLNLSSATDVKREYQSLFSQLQANPSDADTLARIQGLQSIMSRTAAGRATIQQTFANALSGTAPIANDMAQALQSAASGLATGDNFAAINASNSGFANMITDLSQRSFNVRAATANDVMNAYQARAVQNVTASSLAQMASSQRQNLISRAPSMALSEIENLARAAGGALAQGNLTQSATGEMQRLLASCFGSGSPTVGGPTNKSSQALATATPEAVDGIINYIRQLSSSNTLATSPTAQKLVQDIAENARIAFSQNNLDSEGLDRMMKIAKAANEAGIKDANGNTF